jgi:glycosyltransferase involved in cell wall biosynthesis
MRTRKAEDEARKRVLMVTSVLARGGCERQMLATAQGLLQRGYTIEIFTLGPVPAGDASFAAEFAALGINSTCAADLGDMSPSPNVGDYRHGLAPFAAILEHLCVVRLGLALEEVIRRFKPDVVHCWSEPSSVIGGHVAVALGIDRIVLQLVNVPPNQMDLLGAGLYRDAYRSLIRFPNVRLLIDSAAGMRGLEQWLEIPPGTVGLAGHSFVPDCMQIRDEREASICRQRFGMPPDAPTVGAIMRFAPEKDPDLWLETASIVAAARPDVYFVLAGHGALADRIAHRVKELGLSRRFILPGVSIDIGEIYACMNVFLMTSRFEGTPNTLIEAQAAGVAVVAPDVGGISGAMIDGRTGLLTAARAASQFADAALRILNDASWPRRAARHGPRFVSKQFNWQRNVDKTVKLYRTDQPRIRRYVDRLIRRFAPAWACSDRDVRAASMKQILRPQSQTRFALLAYNKTNNLGDEIQSIAARQFLPAADYYIDREALDAFSPAPDQEVRLIMNGWFCHRPERWPPSPSIRPLLIRFMFHKHPACGPDCGRSTCLHKTRYGNISNATDQSARAISAPWNFFSDWGSTPIFPGA